MIKNLTKLQYFYIGLVVLTLIFAGIFVAKNGCWHCKQKKHQFNNLFLKKLNSNNLIDQIKKIQIEFNGEKLTIVADHNANKWVVLEKGNYPVLDSKIKELVWGLADLKIIEQKTIKPENFSALQLEDINVNKNASRITLLDADNKEIESIYIGKREFIASPNADYQAHIFVRRSSELQSWLVAGRLADGFAFKDLVKQPILTIDLADISEINLTKQNQEKSSIKIKRNLTTGESQLLDIPPKYQVREQYVLDNIVQQFAYLNYDDVIQDSSQAVPVMQGNVIWSVPNNNGADSVDTIKDAIHKKNSINFELVYINNNYYLKINDTMLEHSNWLYKISDYACQSLLVNKKDLLIELKPELKNKGNKK